LIVKAKAALQRAGRAHLLAAQENFAGKIAESRFQQDGWQRDDRRPVKRAT